MKEAIRISGLFVADTIMRCCCPWDIMYNYKDLMSVNIPCSSPDIMMSVFQTEKGL